ncbi:ICE-like protease (caspase) p20 domain protein [Rhizoctonia solani 123E]|uniref:ICE-like protease (Caspase) p20 domain protein n=1 Tax=Rhizoctonia solani 123E TaxID=1423351 RepID=A0A074RGX1_9AGAM|nr:ICE-like protease (caspase) p20 domain protein [Rhizoctonia solani 123E]
MSAYIQQVDVSVTAPSRPLTKSFAGFRDLVVSDTGSVAVLITNRYAGMRWPDSTSMTLNGAHRDRVNAQKFLDKFTPGIRVVSVENARREDIEGQIEKIQDDVPPLAVVYVQGHGERKPGAFQYITDDRKRDGTLEGLDGEELLHMFSKVNIRTMSVVITDFCYSGNLFRLRYRLFVSPDGKGFCWLETSEWKQDNNVMLKHRITSPMLHVAGSLESQETYETVWRGGYLTNTLAKAEPNTLPAFLFCLRQGVDGHMRDAKAHPDKPLRQDANQYPQIFCSCTPSLEDPEFFAQLYPGSD